MDKQTNKKAKLTCCITGTSRQSSHRYINEKAARLGVTADDFTSNYVTKSTYLNLKQDLTDKPVSVVLHDLNLDGQRVEKILRFNGKSKKQLDDFKGKTKEQVTETQEPVAV